MAKLVRAIGTFACAVKGVERLVHAGQLLPPNDPLVKARPELFEAVSSPEERAK
jgi:hypothetical protein